MFLKVSFGPKVPYYLISLLTAHTWSRWTGRSPFETDILILPAAGNVTDKTPPRNGPLPKKHASPQGILILMTGQCRGIKSELMSMKDNPKGLPSSKACSGTSEDFLAIVLLPNIAAFTSSQRLLLNNKECRVQVSLTESVSPGAQLEKVGARSGSRKQILKLDFESGPHHYTRTWMPSHFNHVQLCDPMDCSPPVYSVQGIFQARILEQVAMPSSRESSTHQRSNPGLMSPALAGVFFFFFLPLAPPGKPSLHRRSI